MLQMAIAHQDFRRFIDLLVVFYMLSETLGLTLNVGDLHFSHQASIINKLNLDLR